tara:strand:- start:1423 stop:1752 length:330 start_codon:yes stop_codon:yes gene_type:complete
MNYYLVIGVHRSPWCSEQDYNTYLPFHHEVISEKALTAEDLIKSFKEEVKEFWELCFDDAIHELSEEELKNCNPDDGYINAEYFLVSGKPFDIENIEVHGLETGEHLGM